MLLPQRPRCVFIFIHYKLSEVLLFTITVSFQVSTEGDKYLDDFKPGRDQSDFGGFRQPDTLASFVSSKSGDVTTASQSDADSGNKS
jgi:hypothetical protein